MLILIPCLYNLALCLAHDLSESLSVAPSPIIQSSQALLPLHNRGSSGASTNHQDPLICLRLRLRLKTVTKFLQHKQAPRLSQLHSHNFTPVMRIPGPINPICNPFPSTTVACNCPYTFQFLPYPGALSQALLRTCYKRYRRGEYM